MNAFQIVTVVRALLEAQQTDDQIAAVIERMTGNGETLATDTEQPQATASEPAQPQATAAPRTIRRAGIGPSVRYHLNGNVSGRIAQLTGRKLQIASIVRDHNRTGITKREAWDLAKQTDEQYGLSTSTNGSMMSALDGLRTAGIIKSVAIEPTAQPAPRRAAAVPAPGAIRPAKR